jgi:hypothetical protein
MRVRVLFLTSGIRAVLFYSLNISCSSPSHASLGPQPTAGTPAVPVHPSSPAQTSSSSSEATSSPRSSPPLARHVRRTVSALSHLERAAPAGGRGCRGRGTLASGDRDCSDSGKGGKALPPRTGTMGSMPLPPWAGTMVTMGSRPLSGMSVPAVSGLPSPKPTTLSGPR